MPKTTQPSFENTSELRMKYVTGTLLAFQKHFFLCNINTNRRWNVKNLKVFVKARMSEPRAAPALHNHSNFYGTRPACSLVRTAFTFFCFGHWYHNYKYGIGQDYNKIILFSPCFVRLCFLKFLVCKFVF